jgi:hypothetical protein
MNTKTCLPVLDFSYEKIEESLHAAIDIIEFSHVMYEVRSQMILLVLRDWHLLKKEFPDWVTRINYTSDELPIVQFLGSKEEAQKKGYRCSFEHPKIVILLWKELAHISRRV